MTPILVHRATPAGGSLPVADLRRRLADLFIHRPAIYWTDFLLTILAGHVCYALVRRLPEMGLFSGAAALRVVLPAAAFFLACLLYYRAAMFIHELAHLPKRPFRAFRIVWNLLCGIPFLMPSFVYENHGDHHRRDSYGTRRDGEYFALAELRPWHAILYWTQGLYGPLLGVLRFLVLPPLAWLIPPLRRWVFQHASSLVIDPSYLRPLPARRQQWPILLQEGACFAWCLGVAIAVVVAGSWPYPFLIQAYATGVVVITLNAIRTAVAHRWRSDREREMTVEEQVLDSVTIDSQSLAAVLICPVGLRYHALHHLFPSLPYHNLGKAHRRLMVEVPANSAYRASVERSLFEALVRLRSRRPGCEPVPS